jgi:hypothetical protein
LIGKGTETKGDKDFDSDRTILTEHGKRCGS